MAVPRKKSRHHERRVVDVGEPEIAPHHAERQQHDVCRQRAYGRQEPHDDEEDDPGACRFR